MDGRRRAPVFTENFSRNLDALRLFLEPEGRAAFERLLDRLFDDIVPMLCRHSQSGRIFLQHSIRSKEARSLARKLKTFLKKGDTLREFVVDDYLILYLHRDLQVIFLSIKHHRQLSFDLRRFW
ncbi:MAG: type II toxin-antitoxin system RelE/ParE family toxin [Acidobacteria bacterium]|nr:type II toxin-antitoxin system RelE/ParE family toxin [Acidobacteriota bacterium]MBI3657942.1 type II toxin-antitoxin system RelE/ParE family toxin [Acidobacteriota bacterium]